MILHDRRFEASLALHCRREVGCEQRGEHKQCYDTRHAIYWLSHGRHLQELVVELGGAMPASLEHKQPLGCTKSCSGDSSEYRNR